MKLGVGRRWIKRRCQLTIADGVDVRRAHLYHNVPGAAQEGGVFLPPWSAGDEGHQHIVPAIGAIDKDLVASIKAGAPAFREVRHYAENQPLRARDTWRSCRYCMGASSELAATFRIIQSRKSKPSLILARVLASTRSGWPPWAPKGQG